VFKVFFENASKMDDCKMLEQHDYKFSDEILLGTMFCDNEV